MRALGFALLVGVAIAACSGGKPADSAAGKKEPSTSAAGDENSKTTPSEKAPSEKPEANSAKKPSDEPAPDISTRDIKYIVTGGKVEVEVAGCRFRPAAKAVKVGGGWGVKVSVEGEAKDDKMHSLLQSNNGPLAFAGKLTQKGQTTDINDQREGAEDGLIAPGTPITFERVWPGKGGRPLAKGDKLQLEVGLWGLSSNPNPSARRLVRKFIIVTMTVDKGEPHALVQPPE